MHIAPRTAPLTRLGTSPPCNCLHHPAIEIRRYHKKWSAASRSSASPDYDRPERVPRHVAFKIQNARSPPLIENGIHRIERGRFSTTLDRRRIAPVRTPLCSRAFSSVILITLSISRFRRSRRRRADISILPTLGCPIGDVTRGRPETCSESRSLARIRAVFIPRRFQTVWRPNDATKVIDFVSGTTLLLKRAPAEWINPYRVDGRDVTAQVGEIVASQMKAGGGIGCITC
jgi:hypothetical protein